MKAYNQRAGMLASPKYDQVEVARQHDAFYAPEYVPDPPADHIRVERTTIDRLEQTSFDFVTVAPICYDSRVSSHCFFNCVTSMISECAVLQEGGSRDACPPGEGYDPKSFALKIGEAPGDHHDSFNDTGDSNVIAGLPIPEGCFHTCPEQDQND